MKLFVPLNRKWEASILQKVTNLFIFALFVVALALTEFRPTTPTGFGATISTSSPTGSEAPQKYSQVPGRVDQTQVQSNFQYDDLTREAGYNLFFTAQELALSFQKNASYRYIQYLDQTISDY